MSIRLYDSAWVRLEGIDTPQRVTKDEKNLAQFIVDAYRYDIDGRPIGAEFPKILELLSLQAAKEAGLKADYNRDAATYH